MSCIAVAEDHRITVLQRKDVPSFAAALERTPIGATYRGVDVLTAAPGPEALQLLVALKLLERLLPCPRKATGQERSSAVDLAVHGAFQACDLHPVADDELTPESMRYLVGDERIGILTRCLRRGAPLPAASERVRTVSFLVQAISDVVDGSLGEAVGGKLR